MPAEGFGSQERNLALFQSGEGQKKEYALKRLREAKEVREAAQREQLALVEEENRRREEALAM